MESSSSISAVAQNAPASVPTMMLKKALDIQSQSALQLINSIPQPPQTSAANLPSHLGQNINTTA